MKSVRTRNSVAPEYFAVDLGDYIMSDKHLARLAQAERQGVPIDAFVLSCPAYAHEQDIYTFEGLSGEVPMMATQHLDGLEPLINLLAKRGAQLAVHVLVADVEAHNQALTNRYTQGDSRRYLNLCAQSRAAISSAFKQPFKERGIQLEATTFLSAFEPDGKVHNDGVFMQTRQAYKAILEARYVSERSFEFKVGNTIRSRMNDGYYAREYGEIHLPRFDVLVDRELTTMSEYLALGSLIGNLTCQPLIVVHSSNNTYLLNEGNTFNTEGQETNRPAMPLLIRQKRVY